MAYLIFALVPVVMALLLVMPRLEEWCTSPGAVTGFDPPVPALAGPEPAVLQAPVPAPLTASGLEAGGLAGELPA